MLIIAKIINLLIARSLLATSQWLSSTHSSLLQKPNLDKENLSNYRPISNLSFLSKLTWRIVLSRLNDYLSSNSLLNPPPIWLQETLPQNLCLSLCIRRQPLASLLLMSSTSLLHSTLGL